MRRAIEASAGSRVGRLSCGHRPGVPRL